MNRSQALGLERLLVRLIAAHSVAVGVGLTLFPERILPLVGWGTVEPLFFVRQGGVFHLVVAIGYLLEYQRRGSVTFLVTTKSIACVFLILVWALGDPPWVIPFSGVTDGMMGLVAALVHQAVVNRPRLGTR